MCIVYVGDSHRSFTGCDHLIKTMRILDGSDRLQMSLDNVSPNSLVKGQLQHSDLFCSQHQVTKQRVEVETYMDTLSDINSEMLHHKR